MGKSSETFAKKEKEKLRSKRRQEKEEKKQERKDKARDGNDLDSMLAYIDENGNISSTPPDPSRKVKIDASSIAIGVPRQEASDDADTNSQREGVVTMFNNSKGYGFIKDSKNGDSIFAHVNSAIDLIKEGDKVTFTVEMGHKGKNAVDIKKI